MKLYYFESPNPRKPCAVARYLELPMDFVRIDLARGEHQSPEFLAVNPNGKVPAMQDGEVKLWESHAIMAYLARMAGSDLWPEDDFKKIDVTKWLTWDMAHFSRHAGALIFQNVIKPDLFGEQPDSAAVEESTGFFHKFAKVLDDYLAGRDNLVGDSITIADFGVAASLPMAEQAMLPVAGYGNILRWHDRLNELEAWRSPFPEMPLANVQPVDMAKAS
ncbi:Glutathione S-transferase GstB [Defluviimonas aquaemixtae]|uniref:Glutathione S-transferase GstB n=1 Tax=Albidovulum aquaemixtae TaxID=1542388 RepID=A0A2R8BLV3_9RHOB|nr:glutathione S-transferase family protein [Defluviimonas aquaemixtae]SPH24424.1 Glutathione S-transferase GstB [Defluviimonas aquaemixtae]